MKSNKTTKNNKLDIVLQCIIFVRTFRYISYGFHIKTIFFLENKMIGTHV